MLFVRRTGDWPGFGWRNPFEELERMRRQMDWLSTSFSRGPSGEAAAGVFPTMNVTEDQDNYYVRAELPGLKADELDISVTGDTLAISGERKLPIEDGNAQYHRRERDAGKFSRIVNLPAQIDVDNVKARCTDGVLTVTLPKAETAKPKRIVAKAP
jgi:HSP20 family protein